MTSLQEQFYLNSDVESDEDRRDGHTGPMCNHWSNYYDSDRFDTLNDFQIFQLEPKLVSLKLNRLL